MIEARIGRLVCDKMPLLTGEPAWQDLAKLTSPTQTERLSATEAENVIKSLQLFSISEIGGSKWITQQEALEKLNAQAHENAQQHSDEFVVEGLVSYDKMSLLVQELLVFEVWKAKVFPYLRSHFACHLDSVTSYLVLFHELALANLLEVTLFHRHACEAVSEQALVELCDWCHRKVTVLQSLTSQAPPADKLSAKELLEKTPEDTLQDQETEMTLGTCMASLTILRYISDHVLAIPLGIIPRLMRTDDIISALVPLIDSRPWMRQRGSCTEVYAAGQWAALPATHRLRVTQHEAQVWLTLHNLLTEPACRSHCTFDGQRIEQLQRLRPYLTDILVDQVPVLKGLQQLLDQLVLSSGQGASNTRNTCLIIEQVPSLREALLNCCEWQQIADKQRTSVFGGAQSVSRSRLEAFMQSLDLLDADVANQTKQVEDPAVVKVHVWRCMKLDLLEPWCDYACPLDESVAPEPVHLAGADGTYLCGTRHRLQLIEVNSSSKALPSRAKVSVVYGGTSAEAWMNLPTAPTRAAISELPAVVWVTVGLLATDGFALQMKCKKGAAVHRDQQTGSWCVYSPVGGAFNVTCGPASNDIAEATVPHSALSITANA